MGNKKIFRMNTLTNYQLNMDELSVYAKCRQCRSFSSSRSYFCYRENCDIEMKMLAIILNQIYTVLSREHYHKVFLKKLKNNSF